MSISTPYPKISVVTPSLNQAHFLEQTLRSVIEQRYPNLEYVVVDGGSADGSIDIIERYSPHLAYWKSEPDRGHGDGLNKGFGQTSGEIMGWLNSDDVYMPWTFDVVAEVFTSYPDILWLTGMAATLNKKGQCVGMSHNFRNKYDFLIGRYAWIQQEGTFWRRSLWEAAGGRINESYRLQVDGELWSRFFLHARLHHVNSVLGAFREWGGNRSRKYMDQCHADMKRCIETMRQACDASTKHNLNKIEEIILHMRNSPGVDLSQDLRWSVPFDEVGYDCVVYADGQWKKGMKPFAITV